ncbi:MAG: TrmB family transcriptional regulator [Candidatus Bathyarchaeia archaeon]
MFTDERHKNVALLRSIGFTENEALIYLHLLDVPEGRTLEEIVANLSLPSPDIQEALGRLVSKGTLRVFSNQFEAVDPGQVLENILRRQRGELERRLEESRNTVSTLRKLLEPLYWEKRLGIRPAEVIEPLRDLTAMELKTVEVVGKAANSIVIFTETFGWYERVREELIAALDRGIEARVLMLIVDRDSKRRAKDLKQLGVKVRHCAEEWYPVRGTLADKKELVFLIWATKKRDVPHPVHYRPHYTTNVGLIKVFTDAFEKRWEEARPV